MRVAILVPELRRHDAVSNDSVQMCAALRAQGHEVRVFALSAEGVDEPIGAPSALPGWLRSPRDVVIYHFCTRWDLAVDLLARVSAVRIVRYHNITPAGFFRGWSKAHEAACEDGRRQIGKLARMGCELYLGCSPYNLEDFVAHGVDPSACAVLPPFHECASLLSETPDRSKLPDTGGAPLLLMVGRIAPNKGHLELVDALAACRAEVDANAHLLVLGKCSPSLSAYGDAVRARVAELGQRGHVTFVDDARGPDLRAAFEAATALVMLSAHEGFCVPVVEALALGTPVVAYASSAVPWTLGSAGLSWEERDPALVAASIARLHRDEGFRASLVEAGRMRYRDRFSPEALAGDLARVMERFA